MRALSSDILHTCGSGTGKRIIRFIIPHTGSSLRLRWNIRVLLPFSSAAAHFCQILSYFRIVYKYSFCIFFAQKRTLSILRVPKSDRRGSNPRSRPWQGRALPTTPLSHKRVMGIEPTYPAWKAGVLPLNYARMAAPIECSA